MNNDIENLRRRIIYRSNYRGTKEMDNLIGSFVKTYITRLDYKELKELEILLNYDDETLFKIYNKELDTSGMQEKNIIKLFKNYNL